MGKSLEKSRLMTLELPKTTLGGKPPPRALPPSTSAATAPPPPPTHTSTEEEFDDDSDISASLPRGGKAAFMRQPVGLKLPVKKGGGSK